MKILKKKLFTHPVMRRSIMRCLIMSTMRHPTRVRRFFFFLLRTSLFKELLKMLSWSCDNRIRAVVCACELCWVLWVSYLVLYTFPMYIFPRCGAIRRSCSGHNQLVPCKLNKKTHTHTNLARIFGTPAPHKFCKQRERERKRDREVRRETRT